MADSQVVKKGTIKGYLDNPSVKARINDLLNERAGQFVTSLLSLVSNDALLAEAEPGSLFNAALTAASLDLPINKNLGFAHIIGYRNNKKFVRDSEGNFVKGEDGRNIAIVEAQFQIGYKGFIQLAQRTGQYKTINATAVYEGQLISEDPLSGNQYDWTAKKSDKIIGYVSRFILTTGFESDLYMSLDDITAHAKRYSQAYKSGYGPWKDNFDAMALKTVIKLNISKYGPQSTELQRAITFDQAVVKDDNPDYVDGNELAIEDVGADADKKKAIVAANKEEKDNGDGTVTKPGKTPGSKITTTKEPAEPKETVAEKANRKWGPKTQAKLIDEEPGTNDNSPSSDPGNG